MSTRARLEKIESRLGGKDEPLLIVLHYVDHMTDELPQWIGEILDTHARVADLPHQTVARLATDVEGTYYAAIGSELYRVRPEGLEPVSDQSKVYANINLAAI